MAISRKRGTNARRIPKSALVAGPLALVATATVVTAGVARQPARAGPRPVAADRAIADLTDRARAVSRSELPPRPRPQGRTTASSSSAPTTSTCPAPPSRRPSAAPHQRRWTTAPLNLWSSPGARRRPARPGRGRREGARHRPRTTWAATRSSSTAGPRWVTAGYLDDSKPVVDRAVAPQGRPADGAEPRPDAAPRPGAGLSTAPCPDSSIENGLTSSAVMVYRAVCHAFPQITTYGG